MKQQSFDVAVIGGGCAGMAAALAARKNGAANVAIFERSPALGGVLRQCIHNGFGVHRFQEDLTGVEYAQRFLDEIEREAVPCFTDTLVLNISQNGAITAMNPVQGLMHLSALCWPPDAASARAAPCSFRARGPPAC